MNLYVMTIAYDGTSFAGWQRQRHSLSIQESIETALQTITKEQVRLIASGRTDAGVHAKGQVAHFSLQTPYPKKRLLKSLNGILPPSIRILAIKQANEGFHAQKSALSKEYHYHLCLQEVVLPFDRPYVWHCRYKLDFDLFSESATHFVGTHNFKAFANERGHGNRPKSYERTISRLSVIKTEIGARLEFEGNGFLYKMIRNITSMMVAVASGKYPISAIKKVIASKDRRKAPHAAPAQGLFLMSVTYPL
jgi:tRNA pseudouridine38-40 synthase